MNAETDTPRSTPSPSWEPLGDGRKVKSELRSPLFDILTQVNIAAENGLDLLAVSVAVALPDVCGALESDDGRALQKRYEKWCRDNLKVGFENWAPEDLYSLRCGMLHQGRLRGLKHGIGKVVLVPGGGSQFTDCSDTTFGQATAIHSVKTFCLNMNRAVVAWYEKGHDNPNVQKNMADLMQYRDGVYEFQGRTVIA